MQTIFRKPLHDMRRIKLRSLTIIVMVALGLGAYAGLYMSRDSLSHTRDTIYTNLRLSDLRVVTTPSDPSEIPSLDGLRGVEAFEKRFVTPGSFELGDGRPLNSLIVYLDPARHPRVNNLRILEGSYLDPSRKRGVVIERSLAEYHGYRIGDRITLNPYTAPVEVQVIGIGLSPECLIATSDATIFFPLRGSLGVVFATQDLVKEVFGYPLYNEFSFIYESDADPAKAEEEILAALKPLGIEDVTRRKEEFAYRFLQESLKGFSAFIPSLVLVFGLVIFLVTFIAAHRLVAAQRREIGVLRAIGYRRGELLISYFTLALILSAIGGLLGVGFSMIFSHLFASSYASALGLPEVIPVILVHRLVEGWLMASGAVALGFSIPLALLVRLPPHQILRGERKGVFTGVPNGFSRMGRVFLALLQPPMSLRYGVRNLFRRFGLSLATVASVALPIALGGAFLVVLHSVDRLSEDMFDREHWDVMVNFRYSLAPEGAADILASADVSQETFGAAGFGQIVIDDLALNHQILGFPADHYPRRFDLVEGRMFRKDREKAILLNLNWMDAERVEYRLGDWVEVRSRDRRARLEVVGLFRDMTVGQAYVTLGTAQDLFGMDGEVNGAMALAEGPVEEVQEALYRNEAVGGVYTLADIRKGIHEYRARMERILYSAAGTSIVIAVLFLLASVLLNLLDREMEFATLRALGYNRGRVSGILLTELFMQALASVLLSIPLAILLAYFVNYQMGKIYFPIPTVIRVSDLLIVSAWALLCMPLASLSGLRHLFRMNIADVVRQKVLG